jgi:Domain of unknown function (DUF7014)/Abortive infection C-terminus
MDFTWISGLFSRRHRSKDQPLAPLPASFRNRVFMLCRDTFGPSGGLPHLWVELQQKLAYLHGRLVLTSHSKPNNATEDVLTFLQDCSDGHFIDFIEMVFQTDTCGASGGEKLVGPINQFFDLDNLPYALTPHVWEKSVGYEFGRQFETQSLAHYPQVITKGSQAAYSLAIAPALALLTDKGFSAANAEYLSALSDFRKKDYADCLTKCGSSFESVLKVICDRRKWAYSPRDTTASLLKTIISNSGLDGYYEHPLLIVATLRNRQSSAHGSGSTPRRPNQATAEYALTATAAAIVFLTRECL